MESILGFFANMILFTAGLVVAGLWLVLIVITIDEVIDIVIHHRNNRNKKENS